MKLTNPNDAALNDAFAEHIAGWKPIDGKWWTEPPDHVSDDPVWPMFTTHADAVLPWLEKWRDLPYLYRMAQIDMTGTGWLVKLHDTTKPDLIVKAEDPVLARAIVLALLPHYGVEVEFTK